MFNSRLPKSEDCPTTNQFIAGVALALIAYLPFVAYEKVKGLFNRDKGQDDGQE